MFVDAAERRRSEARFRAMVDTAPAMLWATNPDGSLAFLSQRWRQYTGQTEQETMQRDGFGWLDAVHPADRPEAHRIFLDANRRYEPFSLDYRLRRSDGEYRWAIDSGQPRFDARGGFLGYVGSVIDVHERKQAERALGESEEKYRTLFEPIDEGFCIVEVIFDEKDEAIDYRFLEVNPAFERQTGLIAAQGKTVRELAPEHERHWFEIYGRIARTGEAARFERPAAQLHRWYDVYAWRHGEPEDRRVAILFNDITARKKAEEALREADRRKDEFLATLAHELRNPLAPLRNAIELLRRAEDDTVARPIQDIMERQVSHLVRLVDDLMELSRITRGTFELRREPLELQTVLRNAVETAKPLIDAGGHALHIRLPHEPLHVDGDAVRLAQVFANLLNNAAKYTEDGGEIVVEGQREGSEAIVTVTDTGEGIDPALFPKLFDMFSQGHRTSTRSQGGLGIGLALARRLVEMHGGSVHAESAGIGRGSRFTVRLPLGKPSHETKGVPPPASHIVPHRVLVVDDNEDAATSLGMLLNFLGADVRVAHDGPAALSAFDAYRPGIVLLDIGMPVMDGYEVARVLRTRADGARVPLVALTGWGQEEDRRRAREAGFDYHMVKPADIEALQALLASLAVR